MKSSTFRRCQKLSLASLFSVASVASIASLTAVAHAQSVPIVQPGAPGQASQTLSPQQAIDIANVSFTRNDVMFMQNMIPHHSQAVEMAVLVEDRTNNEAIIDIAGRIRKSQADEIAFMSQWLEAREQKVHIDHSMHMDHSMMGMATAAQIQSLSAAKGSEFDRIFLSLMIPHHEGAVRMVDDLLAQSGSAYDPVLYDFVNDIVSDQNAEITRMDGLLAGLSSDPRVGLSAGLRDAGEASLNLSLVSTQPRPSGFFDPENEANLPPIRPADEDTDELIDDASDQDAKRSGDEGDIKTQWGERGPLLSFWNTDMAFSKDILVAGNYHGFNIYKLDNEGLPSLTSSIVCPGGQGDISIVDDLLIMSVEQTRGRIDCGLQGISEDVSDERFRGLRIFDISDLSAPKQVGLVQTCRGSHTHSVVSADDKRIVVYNSGTAGVRDGDELEGCVGEVPGDERTALFRIDVIEIPLRNPSEARITSSPAVFADDEGRVAGLWPGGDHGDGTQKTRRTDECHDITVFPELKLAAGACSGNGILLDISNPMKPKRIDDVADPGFAYWHSATFNNDGTKVLFTDEWGGGTQARCRASDPMTWGANAFYSIDDGKLNFESYFKIDAPQSEQENCVAHNGSMVPVPGRDIFVQAWYQGGISVIDFTDTREPQEIAFFDRGPIHDERLIVGGYWSTYWYNGKIYGTEIIRGLDVLALEPSEFLTENELAAALLADMGDRFNPQQQFRVTWPAEPVIALAYLDQFARDGGLETQAHEEVTNMMTGAQKMLDEGETSRKFSRALSKLAKSLKPNGDNTNAQNRVDALSDTMQAIAKRLR
ncbi:hypothetical protein GPUN_1620 [Glaciecola punicea ACAM 611]|jgi:uncharacterized protein (DUF305 family)|uniref:DUF305 domain-containing protein n=1 Tax=Glaciecola punicea ACAM 611 TaxID=1121923 RepID=H5TBR0_9ALTE|nr:DUF305 domain-containing protein [Glaciecola punicea]OFA30905.1 DUF305 domain-containing protein [Glaciecola punicea]GAB55737.1 hypothetical protein GPUN_1620 [Glaciecola punicea ACAM 611]